MKPTQEQIKNHEKDYEEVRKNDWKDGVQMYINKAISNKIVIFKDLGLKYEVDWRGEFKNWGVWQTVNNYLAYLLAKIT